MTNRQEIYYWKCDRPAAFYTQSLTEQDVQLMENNIRLLMETYFGNTDFILTPANGQGNHATYLVQKNSRHYFIRIENGPEKDSYMAVEGLVMEKVNALGVPVPEIFHFDISRQMVPFAYQIMEYIPYPDLNTLYKDEKLDIVSVASEIGSNIAKWQNVSPNGFGPFDLYHLQTERNLQGLHGNYPDYFFLNLDKHLRFLVQRSFLNEREAGMLHEAIAMNQKYLQIETACLVHKDLALWNILGEQNSIKAIIDWDDTIAGDPTDDLSLLACFHPEDVVESAIKGYTGVRRLPENFFPSFYLHLLRNMIVKAVIRVGGNYFRKTENFFLVSPDSWGSSLEEITRERLFTAQRMLSKKAEKIEL